MNPTGLLLVLTAALCHAGWNLLIKRLAGGPPLVWLFSVLAALLYLPLAVYALLAVPWPSTLHWGVIAGSALLHLAYFLLLQAGYRQGDLSLVYPTARATGPVLSSAFAVFVLGETVSAGVAVGALVVIGGVFMLTGGAHRSPGDRRATLSLGFGLAAGALIGTYTVWDAWAVASLAISPLLLDYGSSLCRSLLLAPLAWQRRAEVHTLWRDHRLAVLGIAVLNPLAYMLVLYALGFTPIVQVAPVRETSVLFAVLAGSLWLGEGDTLRRLGWASIIFFGVVLVALG